MKAPHSTPAQRAALVDSVLEVADGARDPWEVAHLVGLVVRLVPALLCNAGPLVLNDGAVGLPALSEGVRGGMLLEAIARLSLRAAELHEDPHAIDEIAASVAQRIRWQMPAANAWHEEARRLLPRAA